MIINQEQMKVEYRENMREGSGTVKIVNLVPADKLLDKGRLFATITLAPGCSIGYHVHEKDSEIFHILSGNAVYNDNGEEKSVSAGQVLVCAPGEGHAIKNEGDTDVVLSALIIYA